MCTAAKNAALCCAVLLVAHVPSSTAYSAINAVNRFYRADVDLFAAEAGHLLTDVGTRQAFVHRAEIWMSEQAGCEVLDVDEVYEAMPPMARFPQHLLDWSHTEWGRSQLRDWYSKQNMARTPRWQNDTHATQCRHRPPTAKPNAPISCGGHHAARCSACPGRHGAAYCNGDCEWLSGTCADKDRGRSGGGWVAALLDSFLDVLPTSFTSTPPPLHRSKGQGRGAGSSAHAHADTSAANTSTSTSTFFSAHTYATDNDSVTATTAACAGTGTGNASIPQPTIALTLLATPAPQHTMMLMSGANRNAHGAAEQVIANHQQFAAAHGYRYWWHAGNMAAEEGVPQPYWTKIAMLRRQLRDTPHLETLVWIDDDIVFTNGQVDMLQEALTRTPHGDIIVTEDPITHITKLNTGIIIVRNTRRARDLLDELWRRASAVRHDGVSLGGDSQIHCLHEQQALAEMMEDGWPGIAVLAQRSPAFNLNTFLRWSHYDAKRGQDLHFHDDKLETMWRDGDFIGHCSGLSAERRSLCVAMLLSAAARRASATAAEDCDPTHITASM